MVESNDRVTQAVLNKTIKDNTKALEKIDERLNKIDGCMHDLDTRLSIIETKQENQQKDIDSIERKADGWNLINSVGASIAGLLAWFK